jgi:DNA-binding NarL/FixJ family response regulator
MILTLGVFQEGVFTEPKGGGFSVMPLLILVAEDDLGTRLAVSDYLEQQGYTALSASNGEDALKLLYEFHPHLVITDVMMPKMDGYRLIRQIRQEPALRLLPVIFLTARNEVTERVMGYQLGCDVYLPKPFELDELGAIVRNLLDRAQAVQGEWQFQRQIGQAQPNSQGSQSKDPFPLNNSVDLTDREKQILAPLSQGLSNIQIGQSLHLSPRTIEKYVSRLLRKTDTNNRAELVRFALEHDLIEE